jgi:hypothetical protein
MVKQRLLRSGELADLNPQISSSVVVNKHVAQVLVHKTAYEASLEDGGGVKLCDVIALATYGRSGLERRVKGSVTERLLGAVETTSVRCPSCLQKRWHRSRDGCEREEAQESHRQTS